MMLILAGCTTTELGDAYAEKAKADQVGEAIRVAKAEIAEARKGERLPKECRVRFGIGAVKGDGLDVVGKKADRALGRANDRLAHCVALSDRYVAAGEPSP